MKAECESCGKEFDSKHFYDRDCPDCKVVEIPNEAHTNACEACGNPDIAYFDKVGYYIFCEGCYNAQVNIFAAMLQDMNQAKARFIKIMKPSKEDIESAYRSLVHPGTEIEIAKVFDQLEATAVRSGYVLTHNWRSDIEKELTKMFPE